MDSNRSQGTSILNVFGLQKCPSTRNLTLHEHKSFHIQLLCLNTFMKIWCNRNTYSRVANKRVHIPEYSFTWLPPKLIENCSTIITKIGKRKVNNGGLHGLENFRGHISISAFANNKWCSNVLTSWSLVLIWKAVSILDSKSDETEMTRVTLPLRPRSLLSLL